MPLCIDLNKKKMMKTKRHLGLTGNYKFDDKKRKYSDECQAWIQRTTHKIPSPPSLQLLLSFQGGRMISEQLPPHQDQRSRFLQRIRFSRMMDRLPLHVLTAHNPQRRLAVHVKIRRTWDQSRCSVVPRWPSTRQPLRLCAEAHRQFYPPRSPTVAPLFLLYSLRAIICCTATLPFCPWLT